MKPTLLEELWNGQVRPYIKAAQNDPEVAELAELTEKNRNTLEKLLSEEQKKVLEKYICCQVDYQCVLMIHAFRIGFSLSTRLIGESFLVDM